MSTRGATRTRAVATRRRKPAPASRPRQAPLYRAPAPRRRQALARRPPASGGVGASIGSALGTALGGPLGGVAGSLLGSGAQALFKHITGFGDYNIGVNTLMGGYTPPEIINKSKNMVCIRHREFIADVNASSAFTLQNFPINPGIATSFPWVSQVAQAYEEYMITGMIFEYKTLSADYTSAASAALGYVIMATQYNVLNPNFPDKKVMENYEFANSAKPSETFIHPVECKKSLNPVGEMFVRTGAIPANADPRLYDLGNFQIATGGNSGTGIIGELWCTLEVCFLKPKLVESIGYDVLTDHWLSTSGVTSALPVGGAVAQSDNQIGTYWVNGNTIAFPAGVSNGSYMVTYQASGASTALTAFAFGGANVTYPLLWKNYSSSGTHNGGTTSAVFIYTTILKITGSGATITFGAAGTLPSSVTTMDVWITQINGLMTP